MNRLAIAALALLAGCATNGKFVTKMNGFVGGSETSIVAALGPPANVYDARDGTRVISFSRSSRMVLPGAQTMTPVTSTSSGNLTLNQGVRQTTGNYTSTSTTYVPQQGPSTTIDLGCTVSFVIGADGMAKSWSATGNHCVAD